MPDQYYTRQPQSASRPEELELDWRGRRLCFTTDSGVFSKGELDQGTRILLEALPPLQGEVLDLGCGWGPVGVILAATNPGARLTMVDVNQRALQLAEANVRRNGLDCRVLESDGFGALTEERFDAVVTNPPIRTGKAVFYKMLADALEHLAPGGSLYLVIRKQQGAESCQRFLEETAKVERIARSGGFWVLRAYHERETEE